MSKLIFTNGSSAADRIKLIEPDTVIVPWDDVLHDGPVEAGDLRATSKARASFIARFADMDENEVQARFQERDDYLFQAAKFDRVELWFEHDLYDQLQLLQILHVLKTEVKGVQPYLVQVDDFLAEMPDGLFEILGKQAVLVTTDQMEYASDTWVTFVSSLKENLMEQAEVAGPLKYVSLALKRLLGEYPDEQTGLSLSTRYALSAISGGRTKLVKDLFVYMQELEEAKFMGDLSFAHNINELIDCPTPLINASCKYGEGEYRDFFMQEVSLTEFGQQVLAGKANHIKANGINRWIGGVHLKTQ